MITGKKYFTDSNVKNGTVTFNMCLDMANTLYYLKYISPLASHHQEKLDSEGKHIPQPHCTET
jgi:hypothetical protein